MRVAVLQSNYIPWRGYFDIIQRADLFIFYDDVKFTKNDWRNRNIIKGSNGPLWLTVPCPKDYDIRIDQVRPSNVQWQEKHWKTICQYYRKAKCFEHYAPFFEDFYLCHSWESLSKLNQYLIRHIAGDFFGISTRFEDTSHRDLCGVKNARLLELLEQVGASVYISGPAAKTYIDESEFMKRGIEIEWMDYANYPEYEQLYPPFLPNVSIIDLIFNMGANRDYISSAY